MRYCGLGAITVYRFLALITVQMCSVCNPWFWWKLWAEEETDHHNRWTATLIPKRKFYCSFHYGWLFVKCKNLRLELKTVFCVLICYFCRTYRVWCNLQWPVRTNHKVSLGLALYTSTLFLQINQVNLLFQTLSQKICKHCKSIFGNFEYFPVCVHVWLPVLYVLLDLLH